MRGTAKGVIAHRVTARNREMGNRGPVSLAELVDRSVGIANEIIDVLESDPAVRSRPSIKAATDRARELRDTLVNRPVGRR